MSLPVITAPIFELTLPSTGKKYSYRPFLVKEEKILLIALEGGDQNEIINAIKEIIKVCVTGINVTEISTFDLEFIFLRLREKSIGDVITLYVRHINGTNSEGNPCDNTQEISINLGDVEIVRNDKNNKKIQLNDTIGVVMKFPSIDLINELGEFNSTNAFEVIERCIDYIYDGDTVYSLSDYKPEEIKAFVDGLNHTQLKQIEEFFNTLPKISNTTKWKCNKCGAEETLVLEGLNDFFI